MGGDKYCIDAYHNECDDDEYIYLFNYDTPNICIIGDVIEYYYIDDEYGKSATLYCPDDY